MTEIRLAAAGDVRTVGKVFGLGFEDDPVLSWVFGEPGRLVKLTAMFTFLLEEDFVPPGTTWMTDGAGAAWRPPGALSRDDGHLDGFFAAMAGAATADDDFVRLAAMGEAVEAAHPTEPHWYLGVVATLPDRRGQGLGSALLAASLQTVDAAHQPAYLESSNPRNITLYERHGFEVTGRIDIDTADDVFMTPMWRPAR
ncbi:MAG: family N-acetyltransferase [Actinomycetia bacterium]|nr:family N-acetyltransferase [Actinomycetes bacterium]